MIEDINTVAENVVIFDRRRGNNKTIDDFTFRNIAGGAGRMNRYFIGKVFIPLDGIDLLPFERDLIENVRRSLPPRAFTSVGGLNRVRRIPPRAA